MNPLGMALAAAGFALLAQPFVLAQPATAAPLRVLSLDQCADQYVLALAPDAELALSPRADDADSWMRAEAKSQRRMRPTLEAAVGFRPDVVVRYWGGEPRLLRALDRRGATVVDIDDATDIQGIKINIRAVAAALSADARGEALVAQMDVRLARASGRPSSALPALYLTAGGFTAGPGTLIDALFRRVGLVNLAQRPGFGPVSVERIALKPPGRFVLGFFDQVRADWRGAGRHPVVRGAAEGRVAVRLPAAVLTCPAWFAADAVLLLADGDR